MRLRNLFAAAALCLLVPVVAACSALSDPAAFLTEAAELKGKVSDETLGRVGKAIDTYCAVVPEAQRLGLRGALADYTSGHVLEIHCAKRVGKAAAPEIPERVSGGGAPAPRPKPKTQTALMSPVGAGDDPPSGLTH
ncbi:hypothetical protein [Pacificispira sp.]|uniref:hypothetical protein n=1 Tax=Pacificispira sp. TaxID=2888761 RepID=UPI003BABA355